MTEPISTEEKLSVLLRYLATGETFENLIYQFRINETTIARFISEVCYKIYKHLKDIYLKLPNKRNSWEHIVEETLQIGAADGKHIGILNPAESDNSVR